jgi:hypothetical protein
MSTFDAYTHDYLNDPSSELFRAATVARFSSEGEADFAQDYPCIIKRVALTVVAGTSTYTLSDDVLSIRRVSWKGVKLDPMPQRTFRETFQPGTSSGRPYWYIYNNIGQNQIKLFPNPNESVASITTNLYGSEIANRVIVEYYRVPDYVTEIIPLYFRRRLLKVFVMRGCFQIEGAGQNLKNSKYFTSKWDFLKAKYGQLLSDLYLKPKRLVLSGYNVQRHPASPVLPLDRFGSSVDTGE